MTDSYQTHYKDFCNRCSGRRGHKTKLFGGVFRYLCVYCLSEWEKYFMSHSLYNKFIDLEARATILLDISREECQNPTNDMVKYSTILEEKRQLALAVHDIAVNFCDQPNENDELSQHMSTQKSS